MTKGRGPGRQVVAALWLPIAAAAGQAPTPHLPLVVLPDTVVVCRFPADGPIPAWALGPQPFLTISRTRTELSITAPQALVAGREGCERGYRPVKVQGPLPLDLVGIVAALAEPLARNGISLFAISTYETDYVLVKDADLPRARRAWQAAGHTVLEQVETPARAPGR
ncbi:MAG TPA: ACT domain-containing protein [Gemmatimonadales bacterium]|nr:ACT domain-containing protein [Gemmatimonadales bacterium]